MTRNYTTTISVDASPKDVFRAINNVTTWWTENLEGHSQKVGDVFTVKFDDIHVSTQKLTEVVPNKKIEWLVTDSNLNFIRNKQEWNDTRITFEITKGNGKTDVRFTHHGLLPTVECFEACSNAWQEYIHESLLLLIETGKGKPTRKA